jgi:hypothetical protein
MNANERVIEIAAGHVVALQDILDRDLTEHEILQIYRICCNVHGVTRGPVKQEDRAVAALSLV